MVREAICWKIYQWRSARHGKVEDRNALKPTTVYLHDGSRAKEWKLWGKVGKAYRAWRNAGGQWEGE